MGFIPAPDTPPVLFAIIGLRFSISITIPVKVLISEIQSAPPRSAAFALVAMLSTLGESFTINGVLVSCFLVICVTSSIFSGRIPSAIPPARTLGQEMLSSTISTSPFKRLQIPS